MGSFKMLDFDKYLQIHKKYAQGKYSEKWLELTFTHTKIVWEICEILIENLEKQNIKINKELLFQGVMLHDLGVYVCFDEDFNPDTNLPEYVYHGFEGYKLILNEGLEEEVARFSCTHTATGLTREDIERENLKVEIKDYIPVSIEEEILCFADKFHTKYPSFNTYEEQFERIGKFDPNRKVKLDNLKRKFGIPDLKKLHEKYDNWNQEFDDWFNNKN
jgi:uncharacterized protein